MQSIFRLNLTDNSIEERELVKETATLVTVRVGLHGREVRESKVSSIYRYFPTRQAALEFLRATLTRKLENAETTAARLRNDLASVEKELA